MKEAKQKKLNNKIHVIPSERSKQFIENFNKNKPTEEFIESCKKARELFGVENDKSTDQNGADVPIDDLVSRADVLALINKAMFSIDNREMQDYIFNGLRRDVHNLPSAVCDDCIWRVCNYNSVDWEKPSGDLISRQDVIKHFESLYSCGVRELKLNKIEEELNTLPSAEPKWIPVSERLPQAGEICLLTVHEYGWKCKDYIRIIIGEYRDNYADHILAWMPLPKPYREDG